MDPAAAIAILPIGSTEQHGPHLPLDVDSVLVTEVARRAAGLATPRARVLVLPTLPVSLAEHHMARCGTLTLDLATFAAVLRGVVDSVRRHGTRRVLLLNGHGGNRAALAAITDDLTHALDPPIAAATYGELAPAAFAAILEGQSGLRHAWEAETAMMLAVAPGTVDMTAARAVTAPADGLALDGVLGVPGLATAEKGG